MKREFHWIRRLPANVGVNWQIFFYITFLYTCIIIIIISTLIFLWLFKGCKTASQQHCIAASPQHKVDSQPLVTLSFTKVVLFSHALGQLSIHGNFVAIFLLVKKLFSGHVPLLMLPSLWDGAFLARHRLNGVWSVRISTHQFSLVQCLTDDPNIGFLFRCLQLNEMWIHKQLA